MTDQILSLFIIHISLFNTSCHIYCSSNSILFHAKHWNGFCNSKTQLLIYVLAEKKEKKMQKRKETTLNNSDCYTTSETLTITLTAYATCLVIICDGKVN